jgi:type I restriction enzyme S subunit
MSFPRYPNYKDSGVEWLGKLPEHWQHASLRHVCSRITDGSHFSPKSTDDGKSYVTVRNIDGGKIDLHGAAKISFEDFEQLERAGCRPAINDVLFSKDGTVGKVAIVDDDDFVALSSLAIISPKVGRLTPKFLFYFLQSANGGKQIESLYAGAALRRITLDAVVGIWLPLPGLPEQAHIAAFLDRETMKVDGLVAEQRRLMELLKEKRQAVISHTVTKGLNPDAPMRPSGIEWLGDVPAHWELKATKRLFRLVAEPAPDDNDYELLSIYTAIGVRPRKELEAKGNKATTTDGYWLVQKGDLIVNKLLAWMGAIGISEYDGVTSPAYDILRQRIPLDPHFYDYLFRCGICFSEFRRWSRGIMDMRLRLYFDELGQLVMPYPPESEQREIVTFLQVELDRFDTLTAEAQRAIDLLQERRTALISAAVTGQIDVRHLTEKQAA